jgi:hypothetical protein
MGFFKTMHIDECNARGDYLKGRQVDDENFVTVDVSLTHDYSALHVYTAQGHFTIEGEEYKALSKNGVISYGAVMAKIKEIQDAR